MLCIGLYGTTCLEQLFYRVDTSTIRWKKPEKCAFEGKRGLSRKIVIRLELRA